MKNLHCFKFWPIIICLYLLQCSNKRSTHIFPEPIQDYIHNDATHPLFYKADSLKYAQDYVRAADAFKKTLEQKSLSKGEHIYALNQLAFVHLKMRQPDLAEPLLEQLKVYLDSFSNIQLADYYYNLGVLNLQNVKPYAAKRYLDKALSIYQKEYPANHLRIALTWAQLALHQLDFGLVAKEVNATIETAYQHFYPVNEKDTLLYAYAAEVNYAMAQYLRMGSRDYVAGLNHCDLTDVLIYRPNKWVDTALWARSLGVRGLFMRKAREFHKADSLFQKGLYLLKVQGKNSVFIQEMYRFLLVNAASWQTHIIDSDSLFHQYGVQLTEHLKTTGQAQSYVQTTELEVYYNYSHLFQAPQSTRCRAASLQLLDLLKPDLPFYRYYIEEAYNILGNLALHENNHDEALSYLLGAFKSEIDTTLSSRVASWTEAISPEFVNQRINPFNAFAQVGNIYLKKFQKDRKIDDLLLSLQLFEIADEMISLRVNISQYGEPFYEDKDWGAIYEGGLEAVFEAWKQKHNYPTELGETRLINLAFRFIERQKSFILFQEDLFIDQPTQVKIKELKKVVKRITILRPKVNSIDSLQDLCRTNFEYQEQLNDLENSKKRLVENLYDFQKSQALLKNNQVLVQYKVFPNFTYVLGGTKNRLVFDTVGNTQRIKHDIDQFLEFSNYPHRAFEPQLLGSSKVMYKTLIWPFQNIIPSKNAELIIIPDRLLADLPFEAFSIPEAKPVNRWREVKYLLHKYYVVYAPSWKMWQRHYNLKTLKKNHRAAFFTYNREDTLRSILEPQGAKKELQALSQFMKTDSYTNQLCTSSKFMNQSFRYKLLHLCLHGKSSRDTFYENQLYFKLLGNRTADPISGTQIAALDLQGKWAVIAACSSARGVSTAEGTYSLAGAFQQAGCEFVMSSLWEIRDEASSKIIADFYHYIQAGDLPWVALTKAKRKYIDSNNESYPHVWAPLLPVI